MACSRSSIPACFIIRPTTNSQSYVQYERMTFFVITGIPRTLMDSSKGLKPPPVAIWPQKAAKFVLQYRLPLGASTFVEVEKEIFSPPPEHWVTSIDAIPQQVGSDTTIMLSKETFPLVSLTCCSVISHFIHVFLQQFWFIIRLSELVGWLPLAPTGWSVTDFCLLVQLTLKRYGKEAIWSYYTNLFFFFW